MPGLPGRQAGEAGGGGEGLCLPGGKVRVLVEMVIRERVLCKFETTVIVSSLSFPLSVPDKNLSPTFLQLSVNIRETWI